MPFTFRLHTRYAIAAAAVCLLSFTKPVVYQTDYSGTWTLNESKSEAGEYGTRGMPKKIVVVQDGNTLTITKTTNSMNGGENTYTEALTPDGKEAESTVGNNGKRKAKLSWEADGKQFDINFTIDMQMQGQAVQFHGLEKWNLSDDGKTLYVTFNVTTPQGSFSVKGGYDKN
jgi:hypothetical protein